MKSTNATEVSEGEVDASMPLSAEDSQPLAPLTSSILSRVVLDAINHTDAKLAFNMMLVNEHLTVQDADNRSLKEEVASLKERLAKRTHEHSELYLYLRDEIDKHIARTVELEKLLAEAQEEKKTLAVSAQELLEASEREQTLEKAKAQAEIAALKEELRQVHAFAVAKRELEAHTRTLETKLDAQRAAFLAQTQDIERSNMLEQARLKREVFEQMQTAKAELMLHTNDQVASATHRTLLENEHFTRELAFQSCETEKLLERLDKAHQELARLRAQNKVLESNERLMVKKSRYYQKILTKLQQAKPLEASPVVPLDISSPTKAVDEHNSDESKLKEALLRSEDVSSTVSFDHEKQLETESQLQRALEWLNLLQRERQFILAQHDEIVNFLYRSLDEAADARRRKSCGRAGPCSTESVEMCDGNARGQDLLQLVPITTTMDEFAHRVLLSRPALDELSSEDVHEVLLFLLEKLHLYQVRVASLFPNPAIGSTSSPMKQMLERQLGVELPPIATIAHPNPSLLKHKRSLCAHVAAAVDAGKAEWLDSHKSKIAVQSQPQAPLSPHLLATATSQFNFVGQPSLVKQNSPVKRRHYHGSVGKTSVTSPTRKTQAPIRPLTSSSNDEVQTPWPGATSTASIPLWSPSHDADNA